MAQPSLPSLRKTSTIDRQIHRAWLVLPHHFFLLIQAWPVAFLRTCWVLDTAAAQLIVVQVWGRLRLTCRVSFRPVACLRTWTVLHMVRSLLIVFRVGLLLLRVCSQLAASLQIRMEPDKLRLSRHLLLRFCSQSPASLQTWTVPDRLQLIRLVLLRFCSRSPTSLQTRTVPDKPQLSPPIPLQVCSRSPTSLQT